MAQPRHDWYLREWLQACGKKTQQWLADELGQQKSKVSRKVTGTTPYDRDDINAVSRALNIAPFELLLHPDEAYHIRRLRSSAEAEYRLRVAEQQKPFSAPESVPDQGLASPRRKAH